MKLLALRIAEVGPFRSPTALENFSGGLDVLLAPNERGKSTLIAALHAALFVRHTATGRDIDLLKPYSGGHPRVEIELEIDGHRFVIRKYFRGRSKASTAELIDRTAGRTIASGEAAEDQIGRLVGERDGLPALLWSRQGDARSPAPLAGAAAATLRDAISGEISTLTGGDQARDILAQVGDLLHPLTGGRGGQPPANSLFARALDDRREIEQALGEARAELAALEGHRHAIAALRDQRSRLLSDNRDSLIAQRLDAAKAALDAAEISRAERARATAERRAAESLAVQARGARERFEAESAECHRLDASIATLESDLAKHEADVRNADHDRSAARDRRAATATEVAGLRAHLQAQDLAALQSELAAADAVAETIAAAEASLAVATTSPELLSSLAAAERQLAVIDQKLAASAATITFEIEPAAAKRVRIAGDTEPASGSRAVIGPTVIDIAGIGRITVTPGASADRARDLITREHLARDIAGKLARAGAATVADAIAIEGRRSATAAERDAARAVLAARLPDGRASLIERITRLADTLASGGRPRVDMPLEQVRLRVSALERDMMEADRAVQAAEHVLAARGIARAETASALTAARRRRDDLAGRMPPLEARTAVMSRLRDEETTAEARANAAIREFRAFDATAIDEAGLARLRSAVDAEEQALAAHRHTLADLARRLASHEGAVAALGGEGLEERVAERAADLVRVTAAVHRFERDRAALQRLSALLGEVVATTRSRFLAPVQARLDPLLAQILPDARLALGDDFSAHSLEREGVAEPTERLSGGTREQLSVLVRLAFGRLLAESGRPAPLILDDPFVFADDERLERMFAALEAACLVHQVVVLSCHARSFAPLVERHGGRHLSLVPWHDAHA
jgi:hypothetical protein